MSANGFGYLMAFVFVFDFRTSARQGRLSSKTRTQWLDSWRCQLYTVLQYSKHNFNKFRHIFVIFGVNHRDTLL